MKALNLHELDSMLGGVIAGAGGPINCQLMTGAVETVGPNERTKTDAPAQCDDGGA